MSLWAVTEGWLELQPAMPVISLKGGMKALPMSFKKSVVQQGNSALQLATENIHHVLSAFFWLSFTPELKQLFAAEKKGSYSHS